MRWRRGKRWSENHCPSTLEQGHSCAKEGLNKSDFVVVALNGTRSSRLFRVLLSRVPPLVTEIRTHRHCQIVLALTDGNQPIAAWRSAQRLRYSAAKAVIDSGIENLGEADCRAKIGCPIFDVRNGIIKQTQTADTGKIKTQPLMNVKFAAFRKQLFRFVHLRSLCRPQDVNCAALRSGWS